MLTISSIEYSVESATTGQVRFTVSSMGTLGTAVSFGATVLGGSGTVLVTENTITVTGLSIILNHTVMVTATSIFCSQVMYINTTVPIPSVQEVSNNQLTAMVPIVPHPQSQY